MWLDLRLLKLAVREVPVADVIEQLSRGDWRIRGDVRKRKPFNPFGTIEVLQHGGLPD